MNPLRVRVQNGRITLDVPVDLPEGHVFDLAIEETGDGLTAQEREALHAALERSLQHLAEGVDVPVAEVLAAMRLRALKRRAR